MRPALLALLALAAASPSCATTGASGEGDRNLPSQGVGPFRKLAPDEVVGVAPFVYDDRAALYREPAALADGDATLLYAVATRGGADVIVRTRADDGRAFYGSNTDFGRTSPTVLTADQPWEGASVSGPFVLRTAAGITLFYAAAGGIGLATSTDGLTFVKASGPVLARDPRSAWETTELGGPSAYVLPDGRTRLLYGSGAAIGEAESNDGVHVTRVDADPSTPAVDPVLGPAPPAPPGSLLPNEKPPFDTARVSDPCASLVTSPGDRLVLRVLYTGATASGETAIGLAARFGSEGPLVRQPTPVYSVGAHETAPAFLESGDSSYLYVQQERAVGGLVYPAIAGAYAPGTRHLPAPLPFPDRP
ncbi:MAG: hypothetical protein JWP97_5007 [Labilithrix sp.]|nr:hypothetical protein [Labilithrix sp.]